VAAATRTGAPAPVPTAPAGPATAGHDGAGHRASRDAGSLPVPPWPRARPSAARIACWQAIAALGLLGGTAGAEWAVPTAVLAGATGAVPARGDWLSTLLARWIRLQLRRARATPAPPAAGTAEINGERIGVVSRPDALVVVLRAARADLATLTGAARAHHDDDGPRCQLRVVRWHRPRPRAWLVIRAPRDADNAGDAALGVPLGNVLRRLRRSGLDLAPLSADEINATATALTGTGGAREGWRAWRSGTVSHIGLRVTAPGAAALQWLLLAARATDLTIAVRAEEQRLTGVLLVSADTTADRLRTLAPGLGIRLERLDGRHGPAVIASLPIGGTLP
jgi:hypothetical protein